MSTAAPSPSSSSPVDIRSYFDKNTSTWTYLVACPKTKVCALIDTVLEYDAVSGSVTTTAADKLLAIIAEEQLSVEWILETHVHADHLTASAYLKKALGGGPKVAIGEHIKAVLAHWVPLLAMSDDATAPLDGSQFDVLFKDGDVFTIGGGDCDGDNGIRVKVIHTPGHTPACVTYLVNGTTAFVGDTIFMPEIGTARTDFPGGSAETMFDSCRRLMAMLPPDAVIHVGHDYPSDAKDPLHAATIAEHLQSNCMMNERVTKAEFVDANKEELPVPRLLLPSLQVNLRAGKLGPARGEKGLQYMMIPLNMFNKNKKEW